MKNKHYRRSGGEDLEVWKRYASFGGEDKNRMVTIATSLLGGSAVILWDIWTEQIHWNSRCKIDFCNLEFEKPLRALGVALLGMGVSLLAGYISLLYGGYSNRNWERADQIAFNRGWYDLLPPKKTPKGHKDKEAVTREGLLNPIATELLARPCEPKKTLAPVFQWFFWVSMFLFFVHVGFVFQSRKTLLDLFKLSDLFKLICNPLVSILPWLLFILVILLLLFILLILVSNFPCRDKKKAELKFTLKNVNLSGADLSGADLSGADLWGADLPRADLSGADLSGADLWEANLWGADLWEANLWEANLSEANLWEANLWGADLRRADLSEANLRRADLSGADLRRADLWGADLSEAKNLTPQQIKLTCNWEKAIYTEDTQENRKYIEELKN